ncbi:doublecortin domain-containing protein 2-like isoform X2 [Limulus polyphemus]|uniref:Doublecortin domain-containing protein 2-like isoform X2 n=1 Tax=Limulus polyphemus TaxID=6850 RepID=A0ABM1B0F0_LIMPO|nr:doublecortin domain-containing protein 2-like isoform X2 [Limulus polyphemus]
MASSKLGADSSKTASTTGGSVVKSNVPEAKWVHVYINGDEFFPGFKCVINNKNYRNYESVLNYLTEKLQPSFGAVRNIYTPVHGTKVEEIKYLKNNHKYVAAGNERFKKFEPGYGEIGGRTRKPVHKTYSKIKPVVHSRIQAASKVYKSAPEVITVFVFKNGDDLSPAHKFVITKRELKNWNHLLQTIGEKVQPQSCFLRRLHTIDGFQIKGPEDLVNGKKYVAVGHCETFRKLKYGVTKEHLNLSTKLTPASQRRLPLKAGNMGKTMTRKPLREKSKDDFQKLTTVTNEEEIKPILTSSAADDLFHAKSSSSKSDECIREVDLDQDLGGVYKAKQRSQITEGAKEVQDSSDTAIDLPIDDIDAEEVVEEDEDSTNLEIEQKMHELSFAAPEELVPYLPSVQGRHNASKHNMVQQENIHSVSQDIVA